MEVTKQQPVESKLFNLSSIEPKDLIDATLEEAFTKLQPILSRDSTSDTQLHTELLSQNANDAIHALLFSILTDPSTSTRHFRLLILINTSTPAAPNNPNAPSEAYGALIAALISIAFDFYSKLLDTPRHQLLWLLRELVRIRLPNTDKVYVNMLRQIQGGNTSEKNIWLSESLLEIASENASEWLYNNLELIHTTLYTYLRIIADHQSPSLATVRQREAAFCHQLMRDKWPECVQIGRDLVRLLQNAAKVPEFEQLWRDLLNNPAAISPQFAAQGGLMHILRTPTRRRCLISRLTPDMERKIYFLIAQVKFGLHRRYQDWFQRQYLSTPESQSIRVDLIRYICAVVHPTNEQLNSNLTPRWAVIGWLLNTCTNVIDCANLKLALFFDWFFYDARKDNIMLIEPAILIMFQSMRTHMNITCMLMDFLCRIVYAYSPQLREHLYMGISSAFRDSVDKRVIPSIGVFFESGKLDKELRNLLIATFPLVFAPQQQPVTQIEPPKPAPETPKTPIEVPPSYPSPSPSPTPSEEPVKVPIKEEEPPEVPVHITQTPLELKPAKVFITEEISRTNLDALFAAMSNDYLTKALMRMHKSVEADAQCTALDEVLNYCVKNADAVAPVLGELASALLFILRNNFTNNLLESLPNDPDHLYTHYIQNKTESNANESRESADASSMLMDEALNEAINKRAVFVLFKYVTQLNSESKLLLGLLKEMHARQKRLNYFFLFYACVNRDDEACYAVYHELVKRENAIQYDLSKQQLAKYLMADLRQCEQDDCDLFVFLVPFVARHFSACCCNNAEFLGLLVSCVDARQMMALQTLIMYDELKLFKVNLAQSFEACLDASLAFESIEQLFFWRLLGTHASVVENPSCVFNFFVRLDAVAHCEALGSVVQLLRNVEPTVDVVQCVMSRREDCLTRALFVTWVKRFENMVRATLVKVLAKCWQHLKASDFKVVAAKKLTKVGEYVPAENILAHLDQLRHNSVCLKLIADEQVQEALVRIYKNYCDDELKRRFADLFTLIDEFEAGAGAAKGRKKSSDVGTKGKQQVKRMKTAKKANESDESGEDSDENAGGGEGAAQGKQPPRKKLKQLQSDNDSE